VISLRCFWSVALSSPMKRYETGKPVLLHSWRSSCEPSGVAKAGGLGMWMRTYGHASTGNGVTSICIILRHRLPSEVVSSQPSPVTVATNANNYVIFLLLK